MQSVIRFGLLISSCISYSVQDEPKFNRDVLCAVRPDLYGGYNGNQKIFKDALYNVAKNVIASWYTDRGSEDTSFFDRVKSCNPNLRIPIVIYGMLNKDCAAGYSNSGRNDSLLAYRKWLQNFVNHLKDRKLLLIIEPDALALFTTTSCGASSHYEQYLQAAVEILSQVSDAEIYVEFALWLVSQPDQLSNAASTVQRKILGGKSVKGFRGFALNTSGYEYTETAAKMCQTILSQFPGSGYKCLIDTSRNYHGPGQDHEWCNNKPAGIGKPFCDIQDVELRKNISYCLYVHGSGGSDGQCSDSNRSVTGIPAGKFDNDLFALLYQQGYFVEKLGYPALSTKYHR